MPRQPTTWKRLAAIYGLTAGIVIVCFVFLGFFLAKPNAPVAADEIVRAVRQFCADHQPRPATVTFSQLIAQGYLPSNTLQRFGASEVTVNLSVDETHPQRFMMDALMPDGTHTVLLADGSVQGLSRSGMQQLLSTNGRSAKAPDGSEGSGEGHHR